MEEKNVVLSYTAYEKINEDGSKRGEVRVPDKLDYEELLKNCLIGFLTAIYRKEELKDFKFINSKAEDYIFWLSILKRINYAYGLNEILASYRVLNNSRSSNKIDIVKFHWKIYRKIEKLSLQRSIYYYLIYIKRGLKRYFK